MKIIFFGSDDFAEINLNALLQSDHQVVACVTQPDKAKGRGLKVRMSPIKQRAVDLKIPIYQPERLKDPEFMEALKSFQADLFIVVAYGKILPIEVLSIPYLCCMNVHGSLLPKYRGAAPINWAILNGDEETGVSIIKMNSKMDAGDIFAQGKLKILPDDTAITLRAKMADLGAKILVQTINSLEKNAYTLAAQDHHQVTLAPKLTKELGLIDWTQPAKKIHNLIRGLVPWPSAWSRWEGKTIKILESQADHSNSSGRPGEILKVGKEGLLVAAGDQALWITRVHPESSKAMEAESFAAGYQVKMGQFLGERSGPVTRDP